MVKKKANVCTVECPYCSKIIEVFKEEEIISPAQKAEKKVTYYTEKSIQTTLSISQ